MNWATLEGIVDAADVAYRRRFLLEKYPHLKGSDAFGSSFAPGDIAPTMLMSSSACFRTLQMPEGPSSISPDRSRVVI